MPIDQRMIDIWDRAPCAVRCDSPRAAKGMQLRLLRARQAVRVARPDAYTELGTAIDPANPCRVLIKPAGPPAGFAIEDI
jgi:hypothetical protein